MKKIYLIVVILISHPLFSKNLFESSINDVEFISNDIENEKINKIEKIKIENLLNIFEKILDEENYLIVKKKLNKDLINLLIKNIVINDEKIIDNNYYSKIKINFNKKKIISLLRDLKVPYVEYYPKNILLIIYSENNINYHLFSENKKYY